MVSFKVRPTALLLLGVAVGLSGGAAKAQTAPTLQELQKQIEVLQSQVAALQKQEQQQKSNDETIERVMADAQRRTVPFTGGWEADHFILQSDDGRFSLVPNVQLQFRYVANSRQAAGVGSDTEDGFEVRRAKFGITGHLYSPAFTYDLKLAASRNDGSVSLDKAWMKYQFADQWAVRGGLFKDPLSHEQLTSSSKLMAVDRSLLNALLIGGGNDIEGVSLIRGGDADPLHAEFAFTNGSNVSNTDFRHSGSNFGLAARAEYKFTGDWKSYDDFSAMGNRHDLFVLGGGADLTQNGSTNTLLHTIDAQYERTDGWGFYGAYVGRYADSGGDGRYDGGVLAQTSYLLDRTHWEVFGQYAYTHLDSASVPAGADSNVHEFTTGLNYYFESHRAKITFDITYLPNGAPNNQTGIGILAADGPEWVLRTQFQLLL